MKTFRKGNKVKTVYGTIEEVSKVIGDRIYTYQSNLSWWHPTKLFKI
ncbi:hypothetical protein [Larkinella sp. C7]|nr:hypothetical protein [Larkinella sp. C7]